MFPDYKTGGGAGGETDITGLLPKAGGTMTGNLISNAVLKFEHAAPGELLRIKQPNSYVGEAPFQVVMASVLNADGTTYNTPVIMGFNPYRSFDGARSGNYTSIENNYRPGAAKLMEYHYEVALPNGDIMRLFSSTFQEAATAALSTNTWDFIASTFNIRNSASAVTTIFLDGQIQMLPSGTGGKGLQIIDNGTAIIQPIGAAHEMQIVGWSSLQVLGCTFLGSVTIFNYRIISYGDIALNVGKSIIGYSDDQTTSSFNINATTGKGTFSNVVLNLAEYADNAAASAAGLGYGHQYRTGDFVKIVH